MNRRSKRTTPWAAVDQKRDNWEPVTRWLPVLVLLFALVSLAGSAALATPLSADMIVSVPDQELALVDRAKLIARYSISTSKFGTGDSNASYRTPLGTLFVSAKIGDRLLAGAVIKSRIPTGEIVAVDAPGRDPIVSR
jgi:hypothetical protein